MDVAYSLVRQQRITSKELFEKHADPFRTMGRELVVCCECGQPVMLRGSVSGQMRPHFAHYRQKSDAIENAVPCDSRVSGGSYEYIKGEQKKHKTYGLGHLIRRFELYQSIALHDHMRAIASMFVITGGVEISAYHEGQAVARLCAELRAEKQDPVDRIFFEQESVEWVDYRRLPPEEQERLLKLSQKKDDEFENAVKEIHEEDKAEFIKKQTLLRSRLELSTMLRCFADLCFQPHVMEITKVGLWQPAYDAATEPDATLEVIEKARSFEMVEHLFRYLSSRAAERNRHSVFFSALMPSACAALDEIAEGLPPGKAISFQAVQDHCETLAKRVMALPADIHADRKPAEIFMPVGKVLGLASVADAYGNFVGEKHLGQRLFLGTTTGLSEKERGAFLRFCTEATHYLIPAQLSQFPFRKVFEDVLYRPQEIEKHYEFTNSDDGFIYLGHDPALDQIWHRPSVKIGKSIDPERRGRQLAGQCLPRPLRIHRVWYVSDMRRAEQTVFQNLQRKRSKGNKEIFHLQIQEAGSRIDHTLRRANLLEIG